MNQKDLVDKLNHLLDERGIPPRQRNVFLSELLGLHYTSVQKKMASHNGWTSAQVKQLGEYFGAPLEKLVEPEMGTNVHAVIKYGNRLQRGKIVLGAPLSDAGPEDPVAVHTPDGWLVTLNNSAGPGDRYAFGSIETFPPPVIAILDDEAEIRESMTDAFGRVGFACKVFATGEELCADLEMSRFDGFIVDWMLQGGVTVEATIAHIRSGEGHRNVPIVILTGNLETQLVSESELAQMVQTYRVTVLEKPVRPKIIGTTLFNLITNRAER